MAGSDILGRVVGILVFIAGIVSLVFVFIIAYGYFTNPESAFAVSGGKQGSAVTQLGSQTVRLFLQIGLLVVMTLIGSLLAARGAHMYFGSSATHRSNTRGETTAE